MSEEETAHELAAVLRAHREQLVATLVAQAPAAGSGYAHLGPDALQPRMAQIVDACIASISTRDPTLLGQYLRRIAEQRLAEGYALDALITLALIIEGAVSDTAEIAFEGEPARRSDARRLIRTLIAEAERVLGSVQAGAPSS